MIACSEHGLSCDKCHKDHNTSWSAHDWNLNQTLHNMNGVKVTRGKAWEIDNRIKSRDDGKTIINRKTGKPAQY